MRRWMVLPVVLLGLLAGPTHAAARMGPFTNGWNSDQASTFTHVIEGEPGKVTLTLEAKTTAGGTETVAVYFVDAKGHKKTGWRLFVIANKQGAGASKSFTLPKPKPITRPDGTQETPKTSAAKLMVVVENASGRTSSGEYTLTGSR